MTLSIYCCGIFHYRKYARFLPADFLRAVHYSHKIGSQVTGDCARDHNHWPKEYLQQAHVRVLGTRLIDFFQPYYHHLWSASVLRKLDENPLSLLLAHGACRTIIERKRKMGGVVVAEAVNSHPRVLADILSYEHQTLYGEDWDPPSTWKSIEEELSAADYILSPSSVVTNSLMQVGFANSKIITLPYGMDQKPLVAAEAPATKRNPSGAIEVLCVAQVSPRKGQMYLLKAIELIRQSGWTNRPVKLTMVGSVDHRYWKVLRDLNIDFEHRFHVPNSEMLDFMKQFNVFVLPSLEDGFGNVVGEAMSVGLPVVTTSNVGANDLARGYQRCAIVAPRDPEALAKAIYGFADVPKVESLALATWADYAASLQERLCVLQGAH